MTKEEAITALSDRNNLLWGMSKEEQKHYSEALDMAISALKGGWIPIEEREPTEDGEYLVSYDVGDGTYNVVKLYYATNLYEVSRFEFEDKKGIGGWYEWSYDNGISTYYTVDVVEAWQPLPKPYKESEEV